MLKIAVHHADPLGVGRFHAAHHSATESSGSVPLRSMNQRYVDRSSGGEVANSIRCLIGAVVDKHHPARPAGQDLVESIQQRPNILGLIACWYDDRDRCISPIV